MAVSCRVATDGLQALEMVEEAPPNLVFVDLLSSGGGGDPFLEALRRDRRLQHIPVVVVIDRDIGADEAQRLQSKCHAILEGGEMLERELRLAMSRVVPL
jgi:CheY-like chemotaxis protein